MVIHDSVVDILGPPHSFKTSDTTVGSFVTCTFPMLLYNLLDLKSRTPKPASGIHPECLSFKFFFDLSASCCCITNKS